VAVGDFIWDPGLTPNNNIHDDPSLGDLDVNHNIPVYPRSGASTTPATHSPLVPAVVDPYASNRYGVLADGSSDDGNKSHTSGGGESAASARATLVFPGGGSALPSTADLMAAIATLTGKLDGDMSAMSHEV
jgi:hypothetical protein